MRNVLLVIRHEIARTIGKPSFWISAFVFPMLIFAFTFGSQLMARGMTDGDDEAEFLDLVTGASAPTELKPTGYVDLAGVIKSLPDGLPVAVLEPYPSIEAADMAVEEGAIDEYYVLPQEFADAREIVLVQRSYSPFQPLEGGNLFEYVVTYNLIGDPDVAVLLQNPLSSVVLERSTPAQETPSAVGNMGQSLAPMAMLFIFFFVLTMSSGYVLTSVTKEKESRVVEVLLSSLNPRELMLGKLIGLSAVALLQMAIWLGGSLLVLREGSPIFGMASAVLALTLPSRVRSVGAAVLSARICDVRFGSGGNRYPGTDRARGQPVHVHCPSAPDDPALAQLSLRRGAAWRAGDVPEHVPAHCAGFDGRQNGRNDCSGLADPREPGAACRDNVWAGRAIGTAIPGRYVVVGRSHQSAASAGRTETAGRLRAIPGGYRGLCYNRPDNPRLKQVRVGREGACAN